MNNLLNKLNITPGPWVMNKYCDRIGDVILIKENGYLGGAELDIDKPDLSLIAAAPEMLEALINACRLYEFNVRIKYARHGGMHEDFIKAEMMFENTRDIIEKATGKTWEEIKSLSEDEK